MSQRTPIKTRREAFGRGVRDALGSPMLVLLAGMIGFGAVGHDVGLDPWLSTLTSVLMFALPGQVLMQEMLMSGAPVVSVFLAVTLTSTRFITMVVTLFPQLHQRDRNPWLYLWVHLVAMTAWAVSMREFPSLARKNRLPYFLGFGLLCWLVSMPGTLLGYHLAGNVPYWLAIGLVFINPLFFLLTFAEVRADMHRWAIVAGGALGPVLYLWDPESSLLLSGLVGGSLTYWAVRKFGRTAVA